jgi:hypothetical protein
MTLGADNAPQFELVDETQSVRQETPANDEDEDKDADDEGPEDGI